VPVDWLDIIFNPSSPTASCTRCSPPISRPRWSVGGVGAWHLLRDAQDRGARVMFSMAMWHVALVAPIQILAGDQHGLNTLEHQPARSWRWKGHFQSHPKARPLCCSAGPT
jgi:cytochrome d ubiquinol oxidase subunit I